jgi:hypothetical protein
MLAAIVLPQQRQRHAAAAQLGMQQAGSTIALGMTTICKAASESVIECVAMVKAVTTLITGMRRHPRARARAR